MNPLGVIAAVLLYAVALGLFLLELFVPSAGIIGLFAVACLAYSLYSLFTSGYVLLGVFFVLFTAAYLVVTFFWGVRRLELRTTLRGADSSGRDVEAATRIIGQVGHATSALRPAGIATIDGQRFQVVSNGTFIEAGAAVLVVSTSGNRIVVRRA
ncbi:MAG: NfeD family protein [Planctomycetota bacterium]